MPLLEEVSVVGSIKRGIIFNIIEWWRFRPARMNCKFFPLSKCRLKRIQGKPGRITSVLVNQLFCFIINLKCFLIEMRFLAAQKQLLKSKRKFVSLSDGFKVSILYLS